MATKSNIEWTEATWNPLAGCNYESPGCTHCYAATMAKRLVAMGQDKYRGTVDERGRWTGVINIMESELSIPLKRKKPTAYFVNSMSDLFHPAVPFEFVDKVFAVMAQCSQHTFQLLTKRPQRMAEYVEGLANGQAGGRLLAMSHYVDFHGTVLDYRRGKPLRNVWLGTSVEDQRRADERIPDLLRVPAKVRFLSMEPLLGAVNLERGHCTKCTRDSWNCNICPYCGETNLRYGQFGYGGIDWVIVGGESGANARPMHPDWPRSLRDQCVAAGVPFFFKQWGAYSHSVSGSVTQAPLLWVCSDGRVTKSEAVALADGGTWQGMWNVGKKNAGRLLDGREWNKFPEVGG